MRSRKNHTISNRQVHQCALDRLVQAQLLLILALSGERDMYTIVHAQPI